MAGATEVDEALRTEVCDPASWRYSMVNEQNWFGCRVEQNHFDENTVSSPFFAWMTPSFTKLQESASAQSCLCKPVFERSNPGMKIASYICSLCKDVPPRAPGPSGLHGRSLRPSPSQTRSHHYCHILHLLHVDDIHLSQNASSHKTQKHQHELRPRLRLERFRLKPSQNDRPSTIAPHRNLDLRHRHASSLAPNVAAGVDRRRSAPLTCS